MEQEADENIIETDLDDIRNFVQIDNPLRQRQTMRKRRKFAHQNTDIQRAKRKILTKKKKTPSRKTLNVLEFMYIPTFVRMAFG